MSQVSPCYKSLDEWLQWQETLHPSTIDLGLERVSRVAERLQCSAPARVVLTVAGTNGKGSSVAMLEAILLRAGYRVGCYTSPHLFRYNERLRLQGEEVSDQRLCEAFERVDRARGGDSLTYFEFGTLAALDIMCGEDLDVAVLEVGLGGRLDAVNVIAADVALLTSVGLDHTEWLGPDREAIGREKAGIFRAGRPAVCADPDPPRSVREEAQRLGAELHVLGAEFRLRQAARTWHWQGENSAYRDLPRPMLTGAHQLANAAGVLMALETLADRLPVTRKAIEAGLRWSRLPARIETIPGKVEQVLDVSHNAQAAQALVDALRQMPLAGRTHAVVGMMADKDVESFVSALLPEVCCWYVIGLETPRAIRPEALARRVAALAGSERVSAHASVADAMVLIAHRVGTGDRVLICGSFFTVAEWVSLQPAFD